MNIDFGAALKQRAEPFFPDEQPVQAATIARNPYDLTPVKANLAAYSSRIDDMASEAEALEVFSEEANVTAVEMAGQVKRLAKTIEDARKGFVAAPNEFVKSVNGLAKGFTARLEAIECGLKKKIGDYAYRAEQERRRAEAEARRKARELQEQLEAEAKAAGTEAVVVAEPVAPPPARTMTRTAVGSAIQKKEWRFEVEDAMAVPREFLAVDEKKIREAVRAGVREIAGVRIYEETITAIRA